MTNVTAKKRKIIYKTPGNLKKRWEVYLSVKPYALHFVDLPQADRGEADGGKGGPAP